MEYRKGFNFSKVIQPVSGRAGILTMSLCLTIFFMLYKQLLLQWPKQTNKQTNEKPNIGIICSRLQSIFSFNTFNNPVQSMMLFHKSRNSGGEGLRLVKVTQEKNSRLISFFLYHVTLSPYVQGWPWRRYCYFVIYVVIMFRLKLGCP